MSELLLGGVKATTLAKEYQTPLYVFDEDKIVGMMQAYIKNFKSEEFATKVLYASKAFQTVAVINLAASQGLGLDVVSGGEIFTALKSQMPKEKIYFHGNNKTPQELEFFVESGLTHVVCDNMMEARLLANLAEKAQRTISVMLRLNVGIDAHTHEYINTAFIDSKFGMSYESAECQQTLAAIAASPYLVLEGFHAHIGSQIFEMTAWRAEIDKLVSYLKDFSETLTLNIGGGFGIHYVDSDRPLAPDETARELIAYTEKALAKAQQKIATLIIEPGRSLVGEAGTTLYTVGFEKKTPHKHYLFVDGGMTDNIRPALYQAEYQCDIANRLDAPKTQAVTVAGKLCESGDVLIKNANLPTCVAGDILAVYSTGAYGYSMSSNYNRALTPAVVFVKDGQSRLVVKRQTYLDLLRNEVMD
ncbi:diaminopimelate decarboxylase [Enterococcus nangangensis]|uniref:diaminopimelate decarboxylase n=1 Tax=Enterococcus nangangensis TaxID=2559926 RepID=UPI0010F84C29|nr:diaminopimelate decarboxylase [Enterococcus nangangensis]